MFDKQFLRGFDWRAGIGIGGVTLAMIGGAETMGYETVPIWAMLVGAAGAISFNLFRRARFQD